MLNKNICIKCFQRHEKIWDEELWNTNIIECPKEEVNPILFDKPIPKNRKDYYMWMTIFAHRNIINDNEPCIHQTY